MPLENKNSADANQVNVIYRHSSSASFLLYDNELQIAIINKCQVLLFKVTVGTHF